MQDRERIRRRGGAPWWLRKLDPVRDELRAVRFPRTAEEGVRQCANLSSATLKLLKEEIRRSLRTKDEKTVRMETRRLMATQVDHPFIRVSTPPGVAARPGTLRTSTQAWPEGRRHLSASRGDTASMQSGPGAIRVCYQLVRSTHFQGVEDVRRLAGSMSLIIVPTLQRGNARPRRCSVQSSI